jgi:hypothetical protein
MHTSFEDDTVAKMTIAKIVDDLAKRINRERLSAPGRTSIKPRPYSTGFFSKDKNTRLRTWAELRQFGCILIIDAVSLFNPDLYQMLLDFGVGPSRNVAMITVSPVSFSQLPLNKQIEKTIEPCNQYDFARLDERTDMLCEIGPGDLRVLNRWLFEALPKIEDSIRNPVPILANLEMLRKAGFDSRVDPLSWGGRGKR